MRSGAKRCHFCSDANVACEPGAPLVVTPRSEFRALISGGGVPGAVSVPPSEAQLPPLTGTGSSGSYDIVNRPTVFPPAVSSQDSFIHHVSFAPPHDPFLNFRRNTDAFLFTEYNNIILEMTRLYYRRASLEALIRSTTTQCVPPPPAFLKDLPAPPSQ